MANPFMQGMGFMRDLLDTKAANKQGRALNEIAIREADFDLGQKNVEAERRTRAYDALRGQFGDVAGDPVSNAQLGSETRARELQPAAVRINAAAADTAEQDAARAPVVRQLRFTKNLIDRGADPATIADDFLTKTTPALRAAMGLDTDEKVAAYVQALQANPQQIGANIDAALAGLVDPVRTGTPAKYQQGTDAQGNPVYFERGDDGQPRIVEGVRPPPFFSPKVLGDLLYSDGQFADFAENIETGERVGARGQAFGKAEGEVAAEDIATSQRGSNKVADRISAQVQQFDNIDGVIDDILTRVDWGSSGTIAGLKVVGGTGPANVAADLSTIQANAVFNQLQELRTFAEGNGASGLGQVTEMEIKLLRDTVSALEQAQSPDQLRENLIRYQEQLALSRARIQRAYQRDLEAGLIRPESGTPGAKSGTQTRPPPKGLSQSALKYLDD